MLRSAKTVGVGSLTLSNVLMTPDFSAMKTRPSGAKRIAVGFVSPLHDDRLLEARRHHGECRQVNRRQSRLEGVGAEPRV